MTRQELTQKLHELRGTVSKLDSSLRLLEKSDPSCFSSLAEDAALRAESLACHLRELLPTAFSVPRQQYLVTAAQVHGIEIALENGVFQITLPRLLPSKRQHSSAAFLLDPLHYALEEYGRSHVLPLYHTCVICMEHIYNSDLPGWRLHDYDNLQQKQVLDTVALFVMTDDTCRLCDVYNTAHLGPRTCTRISVMEREQFPVWIASLKPDLGISDFDPEPP